MPERAAVAPRTISKGRPRRSINAPFAAPDSNPSGRAERLDRLLHHDRVAVGDVDHDEIDASADELGRPLEIVALGANGGAHAQPPLGVPGGTRQTLLLQDVLRGDEPDEDAVRVDERQFLDLPL